jgi:hypothetical protein
MTSPAAALEDVSAALDGVAGLRPQVKAGKINTPCAIVELAGLSTPSQFGGSADYKIRVILLVQVGDYRNSLERVWEFIDPDGTTSTSAVAALLTVDALGSVSFDGPGLVEWGGAQYAGGIFTADYIG